MIYEQTLIMTITFDADIESPPCEWDWATILDTLYDLPMGCRIHHYSKPVVSDMNEDLYDEA